MRANPNDRTARLLSELGHFRGFSSNKIAHLQTEFERIVQLASKKETFRLGSQQLARLFSELARETTSSGSDSDENNDFHSNTKEKIQRQGDTYTLSENNRNFQAPTSNQILLLKRFGP